MCISDTCINGECNATTNVCDCLPFYTGPRCDFRRAGAHDFWIFDLFVGYNLIFLALILAFLMHRHMLFFFLRSSPDYRYRRASSSSRVEESEEPVLFFPPRDTTFTLLVFWLTAFLEVVQDLAPAFLPQVPWPEFLRPVQELAAIVLLGDIPGLRESQQEQLAFTGALAWLPVGSLVFLLVSVRRCCLVKPQPSYVPSEDLGTSVLHLWCNWTFVPTLVLLFRPVQCIACGFFVPGEHDEVLVEFPRRVPSCWTQDQLVQLSAGLSMAVVYWIVSTMVGIQLYGEASHPRSSFYSDSRYISMHYYLKAAMAMVRGYLNVFD